MEAANLFAQATLESASPAEFLGSVIQSSTEYSIIAKDLDGRVVLWNEGARRLYGYEANEVIGRANISLLHTEEDRHAGLPGRILQAAQRDHRWAGRVLPFWLSVSHGIPSAASILSTPRSGVARDRRSAPQSEPANGIMRCSRG